MVSATKTKKSTKAKQPSKAALEAKRLSELDDYNTRLAAAYKDSEKAYGEMQRAKEASKQASSHYQSTQAAIQRIIRDFNDPQMPLFHGNGSNGTAEIKPAESSATEVKTTKTSDGAEPWRSVPLSTLKITKGLLKKLDDAGIETIGAFADLNGKPVPGIGPEGVAKIADAVADYHKANPVAEPKVETEANKANQPEHAGAGT